MTDQIWQRQLNSLVSKYNFIKTLEEPKKHTNSYTEKSNQSIQDYKKHNGPCIFECFEMLN